MGIPRPLLLPLGLAEPQNVRSDPGLGKVDFNREASGYSQGSGLNTQVIPNSVIRVLTLSTVLLSLLLPSPAFTQGTIAFPSKDSALSPPSTFITQHMDHRMDISGLGNHYQVPENDFLL